MPISNSSVTPPSKAASRHAARTLRRIGLALAALAAAGSAIMAHATYPGENGPIVFGVSDTLMGSIGRVSPGNGNVTILSDGRSPRVSPTGQKIAILRGNSGLGKDAYVMNLDGSNMVQLTSGANTYAITWLPDGSRLAYVSKEAPGNLIDSLWTVKPDGTGKRFAGQLALSISPYNFDWSPFADSYAFTDIHANLLIGQPGGANRSLDTSTDVPSWAPDGASILYSAAEVNLMEINADGSNRHAIPANQTSDRTVVSPDGTLLGGSLGSARRLTTRMRAGSPSTDSWPIAPRQVDWARVPKNCHATTLQGGGGVLGGDVDFYADRCVIAISPTPAAPGGVLAQAMAVGPDGRVYVRALRVNPLGGAPVWGPYAVVPGLASDPSGVRAKEVAFAAAQDGSFQAVIINAADNLLYHAMQYPNGSWSGFNLLDGYGGGNFAARDVAITINASTPTSPGNAQVIANGLEIGGVYHRVRWSNGNWSAFQPVPGAQGMNTQALAIAAGDDGNTNVLAITTAADGTQGQLQQVLRDIKGNWGGWVTVPMPIGTVLSRNSDVALARPNLVGNPAYLMFLDASGNAYYQVRGDANQTITWQVDLPASLITTQGRTVSLSTMGLQTSVLVTRVYPQ